MEKRKLPILLKSASAERKRLKSYLLVNDAMKSEIIADHDALLPSVTDRIHDRWFSVKDVFFDRNRSEVITYFLLTENDRHAGDSARGLSPIGYVRVKHVENLELQDSQKILWYDFNYVKYNARRRRVIFATNIPMIFRVSVYRLSVDVGKADSFHSE